MPATPANLLTAHDRIAWAIERAKQAGLPPERLAAKCSISRPALLHWTKETTDVGSIGVNHLLAFCQATGLSMSWLLTGHGPSEQQAIETAEIREVGQLLSSLAREEPAEYRVIVRMIRTAASHHDATEPRSPA